MLGAVPETCLALPQAVPLPVWNKRSKNRNSPFCSQEWSCAGRWRSVPLCCHLPVPGARPVTSCSFLEIFSAARNGLRAVSRGQLRGTAEGRSDAELLPEQGVSCSFLIPLYAPAAVICVRAAEIVCGKPEEPGSGRSLEGILGGIPAAQVPSGTCPAAAAQSSAGAGSNPGQHSRPSPQRGGESRCDASALAAAAGQTFLWWLQTPSPTAPAITLR